MKIQSLLKIFTVVCLFATSLGIADTLVFQDDSTITGTILQTNDDSVLFLASDGAFIYPKSSLKAIRVEQVAKAAASADRLPNLHDAILLLSKEAWATNLMPIPATVIDKGVLKYVPYSSFHCGEDYEVNIYGDPEYPAGIEIGIYRKLLNDQSAKTNCLHYVNDVLLQAADKDMVWTLNQKTDYKNRDDLTFEITPPTDTDSYGGWWISVYSEADLGRARATDDELKRISIAKAEVARQSSDSNSVSGWSLNDLKAARAVTRTISFVNASGVLITNAEVVRVIDGVSLIYRNGPTSGGMVRLADLPEDLRNQFGYDPVKTAAADALAKEQKAQWQLQVQAAQRAQLAAQAQYSSPQTYFGGYAGGFDTGDDYYAGGRVYVHGYSRKDGTYVHPYTRRYPSR